MNPYESEFLFPLVVTKCPHCSEISKFGVTEKVAYAISFFGVGIGRMAKRQLMCGSCGYRDFIQDEHNSQWRELSEKFQAHETGELGSDEFKEFLQSVNLPELEEIRIAAETWKCVCGEDNPPNFSECWQCGESSPVEVIESKVQPIILGGEHPWEK